MLKKPCIIFAALSLYICCLGTSVWAEDKLSETSPAENESNLLVLPQTIVTADRMPVPAQEVGRDVQVRTEEEFQQREIHTLAEGIQDVSGVRIEQPGGPGSPGVSAIEIRGFPARGTQLMINGLKLNDPSSISGTYESFVPFLSLQDIERVEVMKGGGGVLYGSDSQSGVVNMLTYVPKDGKSASASFETGSYSTYTETALFNLGNERGGVVGSLYRTDSAGLTANSDYGNTTFSAIGRYDLIPDKLSIEPIFRIIDVSLALGTGPSADASGNLLPSQATENDHLDGESYIVGSKVKLKHDDRWESNADIYYVDNDRRYYNEYAGIGSHSQFKGKSFNTDLTTAYDIKELSSVISGGFSLEAQQYDSYSDSLDDSSQRNQLGTFLFDRTKLLDERLELAAGTRVTYISDIDKAVPLFEGSAVYNVPQLETKLHSSLAQGFRAPTLFESKGHMVDFNTGKVVSVGNSNLQEEKALSFDIGASQGFFQDQLTADTTYFYTDASKTIIFDYPNQTHINGSGGEFSGLESSMLLRPIDWLYVRGSYTYLAEANLGDDQREQRRPYSWMAFSSGAELGQLKLTAEVRYRGGQQLDLFGSPQRVEEGSATVCNAAAGYQLSENLGIFVRLDNIFDVDYTEGGYNMPGTSVFAGVKGNAG